MNPNGNIRRYRVFYNVIGVNGNPSVMMTDTNMLELTSLLIYTEYNISVDAVTVLPGERSTAVTVFTDEDCKPVLYKQFAFMQHSLLCQHALRLVHNNCDVSVHYVMLGF